MVAIKACGVEGRIQISKQSKELHLCVNNYPADHYFPPIKEKRKKKQREDWWSSSPKKEPDLPCTKTQASDQPPLQKDQLWNPGLCLAHSFPSYQKKSVGYRNPGHTQTPPAGMKFQQQYKVEITCSIFITWGCLCRHKVTFLILNSIDCLDKILSVNSVQRSLSNISKSLVL